MRASVSTTSRIFRLRRHHLHHLPKAIRRQLAPDPGIMEPSLPSRTKLILTRVDRACLWSACRSASLAVLLILIGATMAAVGFYAKELSLTQATVGNVTIQIRNPNIYWHLHNLSYVGPTFMGLGCVIIVAICVMTFEARDKAAKICPEESEEKPSTDVLYVNVIKNLVRKCSAMPKGSTKYNEASEQAGLIACQQGSQHHSPTHTAFSEPFSRTHAHLLLQKPVEHFLSTRCASAPCFTNLTTLDETDNKKAGGREDGQGDQMQGHERVQQEASLKQSICKLEMESNESQLDEGKLAASQKPLRTDVAEIVVDVHPIPQYHEELTGSNLPL